MDLSLNPKTTALVLIDLQHSTVARQLAPHTSAEVLQNCIRLAKAFRQMEATVIFVHVLIDELPQLPVDAPMPKPSEPPPANASDLVPELNLQPTDIVVTKRQWGAFYGTDLDLHLSRKGIQTIVLGGIATNFGVESTARDAFDRGIELVFAEDAMSSMAAEAHTFSIQNIFPRMGRVRSVEQILQACESV